MSQTLGFQAAVEGLHLRDEGAMMMAAASRIDRLENDFSKTTGNKQFILESTTDALAVVCSSVTGNDLDTVYQVAFDALEKHYPGSTFFQFATPASLLARTAHHEDKYKFLQGFFAGWLVTTVDTFVEAAS